MSSEQSADARPGDAVHHQQAQRAQRDQDNAESGRLALRPCNVERENAKGDYFPSSARQEDFGRGLLDRGEEGEQGANQDALPNERYGDASEYAELAPPMQGIGGVRPT